MSMTDEERRSIEVADMGLGRLRETGLQLLVYVNTDRVLRQGARALPAQTCPEHRHPPLGESPGKEETFGAGSGVVYLYVEGEPTTEPACRPPLGVCTRSPSGTRSCFARENNTRSRRTRCTGSRREWRARSCRNSRPKSATSSTSSRTADRAGARGELIGVQVFLETERLVLRQFTEDDVDNLVELDGDPEVMHFINGGRPTPREEIETRCCRRSSATTSASRLRLLGGDREVDRAVPRLVPLSPREGAPPASSSSATGCAGPLGERDMPRKAHGP